MKNKIEEYLDGIIPDFSTVEKFNKWIEAKPIKNNMKEKFKQAAKLINNIIKWDKVECKNKSFAKELKIHSIEGKEKLMVLTKAKELEDVEQGVLVLIYLKDKKGLVNYIESDFEIVTKSTLPTSHTYILRKL